MLLRIDDVLGPEELVPLRRVLASGKFDNGKRTAGWNARLVKNNLQLEPTGQRAKQLREAVVRALMRNSTFELGVRPMLVLPPLFSRYDVGMDYGQHVDDPLVGGANPVRADVSFTLFLSDPSDYDGGELMIQSTLGEHAFKLPAGSLVAYPSSALHRVARVSRGVRLACVSWVQSLVRGPQEREILYDMDVVRRRIFDREGKSQEFDLLTKSLANLLRLWSESYGGGRP